MEDSATDLCCLQTHWLAPKPQLPQWMNLDLELGIRTVGLVLGIILAFKVVVIPIGVFVFVVFVLMLLLPPADLGFSLALPPLGKEGEGGIVRRGLRKCERKRAEDLDLIVGSLNGAKGYATTRDTQKKWFNISHSLAHTLLLPAFNVLAACLP
ncbi:uncharacterized protein G2W53_030800 [Senna tora]|uniref:Uncharacterized protein n=1 Tax=Senna tora TaxID=362788 RepID=A0A834WEX3_9FABA|nr:uncharacterized protein G2W53_030800 [Senna tora]